MGEKENKKDDVFVEFAEKNEKKETERPAGSFEISADDVQEKDSSLIVNAENAEEIIRTGKGIYKFSKPIFCSGKETESIYFDLPTVSPLKYREIIREVERKNRSVLVQPAHDIDVEIKLFSLASGVPVPTLMSDLSLKDFNTICTLVYVFLSN